jgi:hypothetical protein
LTSLIVVGKGNHRSLMGSVQECKGGCQQGLYKVASLVLTRGKKYETKLHFAPVSKKYFRKSVVCGRGGSLRTSGFSPGGSSIFEKNGSFFINHSSLGCDLAHMVFLDDVITHDSNS